MGETTHPLPSSLPLSENMIAVGQIGFRVDVVDANAETPKLVFRC